MSLYKARCIQADEVVKGLAVTSDKKAAAEQIKALYNVFAKSDCTMVEVCIEMHIVIA